MQFNKITLEFLFEDYEQVAYSLPIPSHTSHLTYINHKGYIVITYELKHSITSLNQFKWVSNLKYYMKYHIKVPFKFIDTIDTIKIIDHKYTLQELQEYFKPITITYPKIYLAQTKKDLYKHLCIHAKTLYYHDMLTLEMVIYSSIFMNNILQKPYSYKELLNKSKRAYNFIIDNKHNLKQKLKPTLLKNAHKLGGKKRGNQKKMEHQNNINQILELIKSGNFIKANNKPNITAIANELNLRRETVSRIYKKTLLCFLPFFFFSFIHLQNNILSSTSIYHNAIAKVTLFNNSL